MKYIKLDEAIKIHNEIIDKVGGLQGFSKSNIGYLDSALEHIQNDNLYPTIEDKLCHLMFACIKSHPFCDGNKRSSIYLGMLFLKMNNKDITGFAEAMEDVVVGVAENRIMKNEFKNTLKIFIEAE